LRTSSNSFWSFLGFFNGFFFPPEKSSTGWVGKKETERKRMKKMEKKKKWQHE
jgi:hypothetical protein